MRTDTILLVDDSPDDVTLTVWAFRKCGILSEIVVAGHGVEALELLLPSDGNPPLRPAIVLLDINMPMLSGLEVLRQLRAAPTTRLMPIIMLTSSLHDNDIERSYDYGANSYLQKPVDAEEFVPMAKALGLYWLQLNQAIPSQVQH
jgi:two-component system response regulator